MIFLSHISCRSGLRIPAKEACAVARDRGIPIMLDGAHVAGQMPIDVRDIGCDFYSTCGHKWLLAPQGIGILYLREDRLKDVQVSWCGWGMDAGPELARAGGLDNNRLAFEPLQDARKFEYGTRPYALYGGLNAAIDMASEIGLEKIEARIRNLASRVKKQLSEVPGVRLLTPLDPGFSSGLVAFSHPGIKHPSPGQWLWEKHRTLVSHKPQDRWMRLSVSYYLLEEELDRTVDRLKSLADENA
jgi:selenocysteine lyase/cysteine desulfurase